MQTRWVFLIALLTLVLAGCGPSQSSEQDVDIMPLDVQQPPETVSTTQTPEFISTAEVLDMPENAPPVKKFVDLAVKDLAGRLQVEAASINLAKSEEVLWPNSALGCPEPDKSYSMVNVPGFRIWLETGGVEYDYHTDWLGQVVLCPQPGLDGNPSLPGDASPTPQIGVPIK